MVVANVKTSFVGGPSVEVGVWLSPGVCVYALPGYSARKSARTCAFLADGARYSIVWSPSSIFHLANLRDLDASPQDLF